MLPTALAVTLRPPPAATMTIALRTGDREYRLRVEDGWVQAQRGLAEDADLRLVGSPWQVMATLIAEQDLGELGAEVEGGPDSLEALRAWFTLPDVHRQSAEAEALAAATSARTSSCRAAAAR